jgi:polysaccharide biosynthesis/export protein
LVNQQSVTALLQGYQVGTDSTINFPMIGRIVVVGLTRRQLEMKIEEKVNAYIKEKPSVQVRFLNFKVNVLGEVTRPGSYSFQTDRVTILDALSMAGDLTIFSRRNKVWLIRETNQKRSFQFINLQDSNTFTSDNYFLKQNDIIYVEPSVKKFILSDPTYNRTAQNISIGLGATGLIVAIVSLLR